MKYLKLVLTLGNGGVVNVDFQDSDGHMADLIRQHGVIHLLVTADEVVSRRVVLASKALL